VRQHWYPIDARLDIHFRLDEERLSQGELAATLAAVGLQGFGKDANVGLGKFILEGLVPHARAVQDRANAWLTLAPCAPQGLGFDPVNSYYRTFTRYGRHGGEAVLTGQPFKAPLLMAASGSVFSPGRLTNGSDMTRDHIGQGLGGKDANGVGILSKAISATVHQGYAPVLGIQLEKQRMGD